MHTHATLRAAVAIYATFFDGQNRFPPGQKFRAICVLPLFHIYALVVLCLLQLSRGSTLLLRLKFDAETTLRDIEVKKASYFPGVPTMWIALANVPDLDRRDLSSLRLVGSGGAPLPVEIGQRFERLTGMRLGGGWGMTETASAGTGNLLDGLFKFGSAGMPLPGIKLDVVALDDQRRQFGKDAVARLKKTAEAAGVESEAMVVAGHPWQEILNRVDSEGVDHIVIGSHGRRALAAAMLGNVTVNVIHGAKVPVTVVPVREEE